MDKDKVIEELSRQLRCAREDERKRIRKILKEKTAKAQKDFRIRGKNNKWEMSAGAWDMAEAIKTIIDNVCQPDEFSKKVEAMRKNPYYQDKTIPRSIG